MQNAEWKTTESEPCIGSARSEGQEEVPFAGALGSCRFSAAFFEFFP
jgi:hypothetical protein